MTLYHFALPTKTERHPYRGDGNYRLNDFLDIFCMKCLWCPDLRLENYALS